MLAAMAAWDDVSAEMLLTAAAYESVLSALLSDGWLGQLRRLWRQRRPCM
ncbi:PPE family domain protein [Mycobacterium ulcerans str. Harvey]|uniref:PPE family domain protein n=1 Tax=Mycobacterium ulcerans str. Harvey TaxID=1299332 RepID=A0ABN0QV48_MYCUL|nr:PPE family domain protein [Mycobacterium ulcerans str. Harvey]EUA93517.1 PPE family domain protein [Mycobacterium ulcerans str. Harvey]